MKPRDCACPKYYVVRFPRSKRKKPRVVYGWKAVLRLRRNERVAFRGFHSAHGAELHMRNLRAESGKPGRRAPTKGAKAPIPLRSRASEPDLLSMLKR